MSNKAVLIDVIDPRTDSKEAELRLEELDSLVKTYGGATALKAFQKRAKPAYKTYIGTGKIDEIFEELDGDFDIVILNNIMKPRQIDNLAEYITDLEIARLKEAGRFETPRKIQVWDRVDLILKIFDKHADSAEAKLQIELASIKHMGTRIFGMGLQLSRQAGGIGTVGAGESNLEMMKRHLRKREQLVKEKIKKYAGIQQRQREQRRDRNMKTVALAGYTNAGKSTLIKTLTNKKEVYIADELFATLDSKIGELYLGNDYKYKVGLADTIGFIQDLPPDLIQAFKTTLAEIVDADLILHLIDISDKNIHLKIKVVEEILDELLDGKTTQRIFVFNKLDRLDHLSEEDKLAYIAELTERYAKNQPQLVSALDKTSCDALIETISSYFFVPQTSPLA
ncbi:MAG: GTPase HflX [Cyanobacteria bacterium]|nr:GTPase HflX [Cyanobacteriota bacterium]MDA1020745.1 GTPase HflX [Cyanobacteriota bacterium]